MHTILELCTSPDKGGLELYFTDISNKLSKIFKIINVIGPHSSLIKFLSSDISKFTIKKRSHYLPLKAAKNLSVIIDKYDIKLIHLHWNKDLALVVFAKIFSKCKPKIVLTRQMQFPAKKDSFYHRFIYKHIDHIIAITKTLEEDLKRFIPKSVQPDISTIYYGVQPLEKVDKKIIEKLKTKYVNDNDFLIGLFGRIDSYKGQHLLIEAIRKAGNTYPFKAIIVGHAMNDEYLKELKKLVHTYNMQENIIFAGFVSNPRKLMQICDTIVLTTVEETFGLVLIEAMSADIPIIGSNRGGVIEIIEHKQTGLLFESENVDSLLDSLKIMYHDKKLRLHCIKNGKIKANTTFNYDQHIKNVSNLFAKVIIS